jgi:hypothetical protein
VTLAGVGQQRVQVGIDQLVELPGGDVAGLLDAYFAGGGTRCTYPIPGARWERPSSIEEVRPDAFNVITLLGRFGM